MHNKSGVKIHWSRLKTWKLLNYTTILFVEFVAQLQSQFVNKYSINIIKQNLKNFSFFFLLGDGRESIRYPVALTKFLRISMLVCKPDGEN